MSCPSTIRTHEGIFRCEIGEQDHLGAPNDHRGSRPGKKKADPPLNCGWTTDQDDQHKVGKK